MHPDAVEYGPERAREALLAEVEEAAGSDLIVAYIPQASMGTAIEMWEARRQRHACPGHHAADHQLGRCCCWPGRSSRTSPAFAEFARSGGLGAVRPPRRRVPSPEVTLLTTLAAIFVNVILPVADHRRHGLSSPRARCSIDQRSLSRAGALRPRALHGLRRHGADDHLGAGTGADLCLRRALGGHCCGPISVAGGPASRPARRRGQRLSPGHPADQRRQRRLPRADPGLRRAGAGARPGLCGRPCRRSSRPWACTWRRAAT